MAPNLAPTVVGRMGLGASVVGDDGGAVSTHSTLGSAFMMGWNSRLRWLPDLEDAAPNDRFAPPSTSVGLGEERFVAAGLSTREIGSNALFRRAAHLRKIGMNRRGI